MLAAGPELRITGAAAQTRMVSVARIRLVSRKSTPLFKGIICDDISQFESHMPSQLVRSLWAMSRSQEFVPQSRGIKGAHNSLYLWEVGTRLRLTVVSCAGLPSSRSEMC